MTVIDKVEWMWKESVYICSNELAQHLHGRTEESHENPEDNLFLVRYLKAGPPEYERVPTSAPQ
jgi:hypothetical protein